MVSRYHPGFGSSGGGNIAAAGGIHFWKTFFAPSPLDIHHMVMKAVGDRIGYLYIVLADG